jgi:hypothetical protein
METTKSHTLRHNHATRSSDARQVCDCPECQLFRVSGRNPADHGRKREREGQDGTPERAEGSYPGFVVTVASPQARDAYLDDPNHHPVLQRLARQRSGSSSSTSDVFTGGPAQCAADDRGGGVAALGRVRQPGGGRPVLLA